MKYKHRKPPIGFLPDGTLAWRYTKRKLEDVFIRGVWWGREKNIRNNTVIGLLWGTKGLMHEILFKNNKYSLIKR